MTTASSAARNGATWNAVIASAPTAAQSERRLKWLRDMGFLLSFGGLKEQFTARAGLRKRRPSVRHPKIRGGTGIVTADWTRVREYIPFVQGPTRCAAR